MNRRVPFVDLDARKETVRAELRAAVDRVVAANAYCLGPETLAFETAFGAQCAVRNVIGVNSGTSALHLCLRVLDIGPGDDVITTAFNHGAACAAIHYVGAKPVFVDIDPDTMTLDCDQLERALTPRVKAVLAAHLFGTPCDVERLDNICDAARIPWIEDATSGQGGILRDRPVGGLGSIAAFSFYPSRILGAIGEAGAISTDNDDLADKARKLRDNGSSRKQHFDEVGYNYGMDGIQAAALQAQLPHAPDWIRARRQVANRYEVGLKGLPIRLPKTTPRALSSFDAFTIRTPRRDALQADLARCAIRAAILFPTPIHLQPAYAHLGHQVGDFPVAEEAARECLSLPCYPELQDEQVDYVIDRIRDSFASGSAAAA